MNLGKTLARLVRMYTALETSILVPVTRNKSLCDETGPEDLSAGPQVLFSPFRKILIWFLTFSLTQLCSNSRNLGQV